MMKERFQPIQNALEFIEGHLRSAITVADIAAAAGYSLYHFIRIFNQIVQHTPYDYLMRRRLSEAALDLLQSERQVIEIAFDFQFNNHETFTRAFGRLFGMPPSAWRQRGYPDTRLILPALGRGYLEYLHTLDFEPPRLMALGEIILAGLMTPLTVDPDELPTLWRNLRGILNGLPLNSGPHDFWGIRIQPQVPGVRPFYLAAVKISSLESTPGSLITKIIPAGDYLCFPQPGQQTNLDLELTYLYHTFLPKASLTVGEPLEIEHFGVRREILIPVQKSRRKHHL